MKTDFFLLLPSAVRLSTYSSLGSLYYQQRILKLFAAQTWIAGKEINYDNKVSFLS